MGRRLRILLSEKERVKYNRFKNRHGFALGSPVVIYKNTASFSKSSKISSGDTILLYASEYSNKDETNIASALKILIEGMKKGNNKDKIAARALIDTMPYKRVSVVFIAACEQTYKDALDDYENVVQKLQDITQISDDNSNITLPSATITHRIFLPNLPK